MDNPNPGREEGHNWVDSNPELYETPEEKNARIWARCIAEQEQIDRENAIYKESRDPNNSPDYRDPNYFDNRII